MSEILYHNHTRNYHKQKRVVVDNKSQPSNWLAFTLLAKSSSTKKTNKTINRWVTDKSGIIEGYHKWVEMFPPGYNFMFGLRRLRRF